MSLGQLVNGKWSTDWTEQDENGNFKRMSTQFHNWVTGDGSSDFPAVAGRYPWAHRTALLWKLKKLENIIGLSIVDPVISDQGWQFSDYSGCIRDTVNQAEYLWQVYVKSAPNYTGRVTVPVLWDKQTNQIVNNESRQIIQMFNSAFDDLGANSVDFYPLELQETIDRVIDQIYQPINNGVYRAGFAASQSAYEDAVTQLFQALETWDQLLSKQRYLCGDEITLADWCLFTTLFRFDSAYYGLFKCNLKRLVDFPHLWDYCRALYQYPSVSSVCNIDHVKRLYYVGLPELNPTRIVPLGPGADFSQPCSPWRVETSTHIMGIRG
jgi:glutathionyl-hydroquinone reductase